MAKGECSKDGCTNLNNARGLCKSHYGQWLRANNGTAAAEPREYIPIDIDAYWNWVKKELKLG